MSRSITLPMRKSTSLQTSHEDNRSGLHLLTYKRDTAVVRGALLQGLKRANPSLPYAVIERKIPEMSYGVGQWSPYDAKKHGSAQTFVEH
jgi:hypothetical protein